MRCVEQVELATACLKVAAVLVAFYWLLRE